MGDRSTFGWAASRNGGPVVAISVRHTRREVIEFLPRMGIGADEHNRLGPKARYQLCRRRGWRVIRVKITPFGDRP